MLIGWDKASKEGDYSCKIYGKIDEEGNWHVKKIKCYKFKPEKEVKKVKKEIDLKKMKFFETKVVKVKKGKKECNHLNAPCIHNLCLPGL